MVLIESWMENKKWGGIRNKFPKNHEWSMQGASRTHKKGRVKGGSIWGQKEISDKKEEGGGRRGRDYEEGGEMGQK